MKEQLIQARQVNKQVSRTNSHSLLRLRPLHREWLFGDQLPAAFKHGFQVGLETNFGIGFVLGA